MFVEVFRGNVNRPVLPSNGPAIKREVAEYRKISQGFEYGLTFGQNLCKVKLLALAIVEGQMKPMSIQYLGCCNPNQFHNKLLFNVIPMEKSS